MDILEIVSRFDIPDTAVSYKECKVGHINSTYFISCASGKRYVMQKINTSIFKDPDALMDNIFSVTAFLRDRAEVNGKDPERASLHFYPAKDGKKYVHSDGCTFRIYACIEDVVTLQLCDSPAVFEKVGAAFGSFQKQLADFDASALSETIPDFHNTAKRFETFEKSLKTDSHNRAETCREEIEYVLAHKDMCSYIVSGLESGKFPLRVTHNDTKLNNILLDKDTLEPVCVIDLDTVMPGSVLYDFGDAIRSGAALIEEDSNEYEKAGVNTDMFRGFAKGFLSSLGSSVSEEEKKAFPMGALIITFETGMRFLTDYLDGDVYFRTAYPDHNLVRARNQFAMAADIERKLCELSETVNSL